jgi:phage-related protein
MGYIVRTRDSIYLDGIPLSTYGLAAEMPQPVPIAQPRYTTWTSGESDWSEPDDSFEDVEYTFTARRFKSPDDFRAPEFYAACANAKNLIISRHSGRHYRIRRLVSIKPTAVAHGNDIAYSVTFALAPFAYHNSNEQHTMDGQHTYLENPGTRYSKPIYTVNHSLLGETVLRVNGVDLVISKDAANPIIIDCERMIAYSTGGHNETKFTRGQFPFMNAGDNTAVAFMGTTFYQILVQGNWRDY